MRGNIFHLVAGPSEGRWQDLFRNLRDGKAPREERDRVMLFVIPVYVKLLMLVVIL